jgi:hypothetical protein
MKHLDPTARRAKPPGQARTIRAIFTHMHNVRSKWVRRTVPHWELPRQLNRARCAPQQARARLAESAARSAGMLAEALGGFGGRVENFPRDGWARPWPVPGNALLHALSRNPPSRAGVYARASARIPIAKRGAVRDLELGIAVETVRVAWRPRSGFLRNRSSAQALGGKDAMVETLSPSRWGCCRSSGWRSEVGTRIPPVGGGYRNAARATTAHCFGLWAVLEVGREWSTAHPEVILAFSGQIPHRLRIVDRSCRIIRSGVSRWAAKFALPNTLVAW